VCVLGDAAAAMAAEGTRYRKAGGVALQRFQAFAQTVTKGLRTFSPGAPEVAIRRPQFLHAMLQAQRSNVRIVHRWPDDAELGEQRAQRRPMAITFGQQHKTGALQPGVDLVQCAGRRRGRVVDARVRACVRADGEEMAKNSCRQGQGRAPG